MMKHHESGPWTRCENIAATTFIMITIIIILCFIVITFSVAILALELPHRPCVPRTFRSLVVAAGLPSPPYSRCLPLAHDASDIVGQGIPTGPRSRA